MGQARDEAGNIWETDAQGNAVRLISSAQKQGGVFTLPTNPRDAAKDARDAGKDAFDREQRIKADRLARAKAIADLEKDGKTLDANDNIVPIPGWTPKPAAPTAEQAQAQTMKRANIEAMTTQLQEVERQLNAGYIGAGDRGFLEYLPTGQNRAFDAASAGLTDQALGAFRTPGVGQQSDAELRSFTEANRPGSWEQDATNVQRVANIRTRLNAQRAALGLPPIPDGLQMDAQQEDRRDPMGLIAPNGSAPPAAPNPWDQNSIDPTKPSSGMFFAPATRQQQSDPAAADLANRVFAQTGSMDAVNAALAQAGYADRFPQPSKALIDYNKQKPGYGYFKPGLTTVQNSTMERISGGAPAAGVAGFTNTMTGGAVKALGGQAYDDMQGAHPIAGGIGEVGGAIGATSLIGKAGAKLAGRFAPSLLGGGRAAALGRGVATDAAYGGIYGGMTENDPLSGVALGAAGSLAGRGVGAALGKAIQGIKPTSASQYLSTQGVDQTFGQTIGGFAKTLEDKMTSIPGIGDMVNARRLEGVQDFNRAAFRQAGEPIGAQVDNFGQAGLADLYTPEGGGAINQAYGRATSGVDVPLDAQFAQDFARAVSAKMPADYAKALNDVTSLRVGPAIESGTLSGNNYQQAMRGLSAAKSKAGNVGVSGFEDVYRGALSDTQGALESQMMRGGGQQVVEGLGNANAAYRSYKTLADAVNKARNGTRSGEVDLFMPSQLNDAVAATQRKFPGEHPLSALGKAGQSTLPSAIPDSGTAGRLLQAGLGGTFGGSVIGGGAGLALGGADGAQTGGTAGGIGTLGLLGLLAAGGTKGGQKALKAALTDSGSLTRAGAARLMRKTGGLFGKASIPLLLEQ